MNSHILIGLLQFVDSNRATTANMYLDTNFWGRVNDENCIMSGIDFYGDTTWDTTVYYIKKGTKHNFELGYDNACKYKNSIWGTIRIDDRIVINRCSINECVDEIRHVFYKKFEFIYSLDCVNNNCECSYQGLSLQGVKGNSVKLAKCMLSDSFIKESFTDTLNDVIKW